MNRRPRLTAKVVRGLSRIEAYASADYDVMRSDEVQREGLDDMATGLQYIAELLAWHRAKKKETP